MTPWTGWQKSLSAALVAAGATMATRANGNISSEFCVGVFVILALALISKNAVEDAAEKLGANFGAEAQSRNHAFFGEISKQLGTTLPKTVMEIMKSADDMISNANAVRAAADEERHARHMQEREELLRRLTELQATRGDAPKKPPEPS